MALGLTGSGWRFAAVGVLAGALVIGGPPMSGATAQSAGVRTTSGTRIGNTYGGLTSQGMPVIVDMNATRRTATRAVAVLDLTCTSGQYVSFPDRYTKLAVTRSGKFHVRFGPVTQRNDDGTTTDYQGSMSGRLSSSKTRISGSWRLIATDHDTTGAVTDTCDSGVVTWTAKQ